MNKLPFYKKPLVLIAIIAIITATILVINYDSSFNEIDLDSSKNLVYNNTEVEYLDTLTYVALDVVDVKGVLIYVNSAPESLISPSDDGFKFDAFVDKGLQHKTYTILIDELLPKSRFFTSIAHEAIHIQQFEEGRLSTIGANVAVFEGDTVTISNIPYNLRGWEKEAMDRQDSVEKEMRKILYN